MKKERVDLLAIKQGLFSTREKAKRAIMAGLVVSSLSGERFDKPGEKIAEETTLRIKGKVCPYVSRGGLKLVKALKVFNINLQDKTVLDIGASTGGFTDVALQNKAKLIYALDVGVNQLDWKIRQNPRVIVMEKTNFRYAQPENFTQSLPEIATIDVSFISLKLILKPLHAILGNNGEVVALIKPQFEAGREQVGKNGIVREQKIHQKVIENIFQSAVKLNFDVLNLDFSPITGGKGNIEFLAYLRKAKETGIIAENINVNQTVNAASKLF